MIWKTQFRNKQCCQSSVTLCQVQFTNERWNVMKVSLKLKKTSIKLLITLTSRGKNCLPLCNQ